MGFKSQPDLFVVEEGSPVAHTEAASWTLWGAFHRRNPVLLARLATITMMSSLIGVATILAWYFTSTSSKSAVAALGAELRDDLLHRTVDGVVSTLNMQLLTTGLIAGAVEDLYAGNGSLEFSAVESEIFRLCLAMYRLQPYIAGAGCALEDGKYSSFVPAQLVPGGIAPAPASQGGGNGWGADNDQTLLPIPSLVSLFNNQSVPDGVVPHRYTTQIPGANLGARGPAQEVDDSSRVDFRQRLWYSRAASNPSHTGGQLLLGAAPTSVPLLTASVAAFGPEEQLLGVCSASQSLVALSSFLSTMDLNGGLLYLSSTDGLMVASSSGELTSAAGIARQQLININESLDPLTRETWNKLMSQSGGLGPLANGSLSFAATISGVRYYVDTMPIKTKTLPMMAVLVVPRASIMASIDNRSRITVIGIVASALALCLVGCLAVLVFTSPVSSELRLQDQLVGLKEKAEDESKAKSQFLSNCSHELRSPMAAIIGLLDLVLGDDLTQEQRANVNQIRQCAQGLLGLLNDLLDIGKIEAGKLELEMLDFDLEAELESLVDVFHVQYQKKGVELALDLADGANWMVNGDAARTRQIFSNLLSNSYKFTPEGGLVVLRGRLQRPSTPGQGTAGKGSAPARQGLHMWFEVDDTGCGVSHDKRKRVFESFAQADASTTRVHGGTGLGLTIVSNLVSCMGGSIAILDKEGPGALIGFDVWFKPPSSTTFSSSSQISELLEQAPGTLPPGGPNPDAGGTRTGTGVLTLPDALLSSSSTSCDGSVSDPDSLEGQVQLPMVTEFMSFSRAPPSTSVRLPGSGLPPQHEAPGASPVQSGNEEVSCADMPPPHSTPPESMPAAASQSWSWAALKLPGVIGRHIPLRYRRLTRQRKQALLPLWTASWQGAQPASDPPAAVAELSCSRRKSSTLVTLEQELPLKLPPHLEGVTVVLCMNGRVEKDLAVAWFQRRGLDVVQLDEYSQIVPTLRQLLPQLRGVEGCEDGFLGGHPFAEALPGGLSQGSHAAPRRKVLVMVDAIECPLYKQHIARVAESRSEGSSMRLDPATSPRSNGAAAVDVESFLDEAPRVKELIRFTTAAAKRPDLAEIVYTRITSSVIPCWLRTLIVPNWLVTSRPLYGSRLRALAAAAAEIFEEQSRRDSADKKTAPLGDLALQSVCLRPGSKVTISGSRHTTPRREAKIRQELHGLRVLVAEDTPLLQQLAVAMLTRIGAEVATANDGRQAADMVLATQRFGGTAADFDVVLMDCQMPIMDGYAATKTIRRAEVTTSIRTPIIALTAHAMSSHRRECLDAGMDQYLAKPVTPKILAETIQSLCKNTRPNSPSRCEASTGSLST